MRRGCQHFLAVQLTKQKQATVPNTHLRAKSYLCRRERFCVLDKPTEMPLKMSLRSTIELPAELLFRTSVEKLCAQYWLSAKIRDKKGLFCFIAPARLQS